MFTAWFRALFKGFLSFVSGLFWEVPILCLRPGLGPFFRGFLSFLFKAWFKGFLSFVLSPFFRGFLSFLFKAFF